MEFFVSAWCEWVSYEIRIFISFWYWQFLSRLFMLDYLFVLAHVSDYSRVEVIAASCRADNVALYENSCWPNYGHPYGKHFRNIESADTLRITRPDKEHFMYSLAGDSTLSQLNWGDEEDDTQVRQKSTPSKTVVIYREKDYQPEDGPTVQFIRLQDKQEVIDFLVAHNYAEYDDDLLEGRLSRLEDETLLLKGHDVTNLEKEQQVQLVHDYRDNMLFEWYELKEIKRKLTKGHELKDVIKAYSASTQSMLLVSNVYDDSVKEVAEHLITRLFDYDYEKMYRYNRRHLENIYKNAEDNKKKYIVSKIEE